MRSRNIKPGFFINDGLAEVSFETRLLFIGLWCFADCKGRFEWKQKKIHAAIFPYDHGLDIEKMLCNLMSLHPITRQGDIGYIPCFLKHQHPHPHEARSVLPEFNEQIQCHGMQLNDMKCQADILNPDIIINDSNTPQPPINEIYEKPKRQKRVSELSKNQLESFLEFWAIWPKRVAQADAEKAWMKIAPTNGQLKIICHAVEKWKQSPKWQEDNGKFIPYPATWLNGKRWRDEIETTTQQPPAYKSPIITAGDNSIFENPETSNEP